MNRFGFDDKDIDNLILKLKNQLYKVSSICSHLSSINDKSQDWFSKQQINNFDQNCNKIHTGIGYSTDIILNSNGVLNFPVNSAVRLGIALYGIAQNPNLTQICSLHSTISQIKQIEKDARVSYQNTL